MPDQATTGAVLSLDAAAYYITRQQIRLAERQLVLGKFATKYQLPQRMGKTLRVTRHKYLNLPTKPLTEGVPPDAVALAVENVDVTVEQWGIVCLLTDVALITPTHPALQIAIDRVSQAMAQMFERDMARTLLGGTSVFFPGAVTSRAGLTAGNKIDTATILKVTTSLRSRGAAEWEGGLYGGVMPPQMEADVISSDQTFKDASNFANVRKLEFGEIGVWMAVRWGRGNFLPVFKGVAAPAGGDVDVSNPSAEQAVLEGQTSGPYNANASVKVVVVARDANTNYERKISQEATFALGTGNSGLRVRTPNSANYVYDIYVSDAAAGGGTARLALDRVAADTIATVSAIPSTSASTPPAAPASGVEVFCAFVFGRDYFGRVELDGMSLQSYITPPGASWSNPLAQGRKVGSKVMWKSFLLDNNFGARIEAASGFSAELPA